jgi:DNA repair protein RadC
MCPNTENSCVPVVTKNERLPCVADYAGATDAQLLADFLDIEMPPDDAVDFAARLLRTCGGLRGLFNFRSGQPEGLPGLEPRWLQRMVMTRELSRRQLLENLQRSEPLTSPAATLEYLQTSLRDRRREVFTCLFLDTRHRVISAEELFQGSIDGACVYPRVVAERALRLGSAAVIVAHNHPSGVSEPSLADQAITRRLKDALALLEIRLLDHFVIGDATPVSMASRGML